VTDEELSAAIGVGPCKPVKLGSEVCCVKHGYDYFFDSPLCRIAKERVKAARDALKLATDAIRPHIPDGHFKVNVEDFIHEYITDFRPSPGVEGAGTVA
jgi:hypothetical protein